MKCIRLYITKLIPSVITKTQEDVKPFRQVHIVSFKNLSIFPPRQFGLTNNNEKTKSLQPAAMPISFICTKIQIRKYIVNLYLTLYTQRKIKL